MANALCVLILYWRSGQVRSCTQGWWKRAIDLLNACAYIISSIPCIVEARLKNTLQTTVWFYYREDQDTTLRFEAAQECKPRKLYCLEIEKEKSQTTNNHQLWWEKRRDWGLLLRPTGKYVMKYPQQVESGTKASHSNLGGASSCNKQCVWCLFDKSRIHM